MRGDQQQATAAGVESWVNAQDSGIKLFGRMISAPNGEPMGVGSEEESVNPPQDSDQSSEEAVVLWVEDRSSAWVADEHGSSSGSNSGYEEYEKAALSGKVGSEIEGDSMKSAVEIAARKPVKVAPCPRCDSLDTKFCYFNNYNVNQPRHFCKQCQRYWTAGGTLRNVPVGAGRRKCKLSSLPQQQQQLPFDCFAVRRIPGDASLPQQQCIPSSLPAERALHSNPALSTITTVNQCNTYASSSNTSSAFVPRPAGAAAGAGFTSNTSVASGKETVDNDDPKLQSFTFISGEVSEDAHTKSTAAAQAECAKACSVFFATDRKGERQQAPAEACLSQKIAAADAATASWASYTAAAPCSFFNPAWPPYLFNPGWCAVPQTPVATPFFHPAATASLPSQMFAFPCHPSTWAATPSVTWAVTSGSSLGKHPRERQVFPEVPNRLRTDPREEQGRSSKGLTEVLPDGHHNSVAHQVL